MYTASNGACSSVEAEMELLKKIAVIDSNYTQVVFLRVEGEMFDIFPFIAVVCPCQRQVITRFIIGKENRKCLLKKSLNTSVALAQFLQT